MGTVILEAQIPSFVRKMILRDRGVSYRITFVSNVFMRDADRLLEILSSRREHCRVLESCAKCWSPVMY